MHSEAKHARMTKVSVSVPAVCTNLGSGYHVLGLALNLRTVVEMSLTGDDALRIASAGEGADALPANFYHPVAVAATRLFQEVEEAPPGLSITCTNRIPLRVGLSSREAMTVAGLVGANNLLGGPLPREALIDLAARLSEHPEAAATALNGGLGIWASGGETPVYRSLEVAPLRVVVAVPLLDDYAPHHDALPDPGLDDAVHAIAHTALLVEALQTDDLDLLREALDDRLHVPYRRAAIPGYARVEAAACRLGAIGVTLCGAGPALVAFADYGHGEIARAMQQAFRQEGVPARTWTLGVDMQGVVISVVQ